MSLLAPLFLLGALAIALPVIFHLIRRTTRQRVAFSSLMFLLPSPPRLTRRSRLEHILLLLLRCAAIGLLAIGFARPFLKRAVPESPARAPARRLLLLVDTSASMRRANLWAAARAKAEAVLRQTSPADQLALFTFDRALTPLISFEQWNATPVGDRLALARSRLADTAPGWSGTYTDQALIRAAELLAGDGDGKAAGARQVVLISDLQEGSRLGALQAQEWPKGVEVLTERVTPRPTSNAGLQLVTDAGETDRAAEAAMRVRVSNAADAKREHFQVGWGRKDGSGFLGQTVEVYVPAGQSRVAAAPLPVATAKATTDRILLRGDDEDFDNTVFVIPPPPAQLTVLYLGSELEADTQQPLFFLRCAFQETRRQAVRLVGHPPAAALPADEIKNAALLVATDALSEAAARALREGVVKGKTLLFAPTSPAAAPTLARLLGLGQLALEESQPASYAMLSEINFGHPLFAPFADARFSDFTKIHFWKYRRLDTTAIPDARVLARFDSGDAAIIEAPLGKGRLVVFASCWHPADSQLARSSKFVPLLYSLLELSSGAAPPPAQYFVGDAVPLPAETARANAAVSIQRPDGATMALAPGATNFTQALRPGIYAVASTGPPTLFAVNLEPAESRTAPLPIDELERHGLPAPRQTPPALPAAQLKVRLQNTELEARQKLWRWFIAATLAVLLVETWLAGWTARRAAVQSSMGGEVGLGQTTRATQSGMGIAN
jgi:hypothetical protein